MPSLSDQISSAPPSLAELFQPQARLSEILTAPENELVGTDIDPRYLDAFAKEYTALHSTAIKRDSRDADFTNRMAAQFINRPLRSIQAAREYLTTKLNTPKTTDNLTDEEISIRAHENARTLLDPYQSSPERTAREERAAAAVERTREIGATKHLAKIGPFTIYPAYSADIAGTVGLQQALVQERRLGQETPQNATEKTADAIGFMLALATPGGPENLLFRGGETAMSAGLKTVPRLLPATDAIGRIAAAGLKSAAGGIAATQLRPVTPANPIAPLSEYATANAANIAQTAAGFAAFGGAARALGEIIPGVAFKYKNLTPDETISTLNDIFARGSSGKPITEGEKELVRMVTRHLAGRGETMAPYISGEKGLASFIKTPRDWTQLIPPLRAALGQPIAGVATVPGRAAEAAATTAPPPAPAELPPPVGASLATPSAPDPAPLAPAPAAPSALEEFAARAGYTIAPNGDLIPAAPSAPPEPPATQPAAPPAPPPESAPPAPAPSYPIAAAPFTAPPSSHVSGDAPATPAPISQPVPAISQPVPYSPSSGELFPAADIPFNLASEYQPPPASTLTPQDTLRATPLTDTATQPMFAPEQTRSYAPTALDRANSLQPSTFKATPVANITSQPAQTAKAASGSATGQGGEPPAVSEGGRATKPIVQSPAPVNLKPAPKPFRPRRRLSIGLPADGNPDLLNAIADSGGVRPPAYVRNPGGEYDGFNEVFNTGAARLLRNKNAQAVDQLMRELSEMGYRFDTTGDFYNAVAGAMSARHQLQRMAITNAFEAKAHDALFDNEGRHTTLRALKPISSDTLNIGDKFNIRGAPFAVTDISPDTMARTLTGNGIKIEIPSATTIYPDKSRVTRAAPPPPNPEEPFETPAEYTPRPTPVLSSSSGAVHGALSSPVSGVHAAAPAAYLTDPIRYAGPLAETLARAQTVSSIAADYAAGALPNWNPVGAIIKTPQDMATLFQPLRNPVSEISKYAAIDSTGKVLRAGIDCIGTLNTTKFNIAQIAAAVKSEGSTRVIISHNHTSGDPTPSPQDIAHYPYAKAEFASHGVELVDSINTNSHAFYSHARDEILTMAHEEQPAWELIPRRALAKITTASQLNALAAALRQHNPDAAFAVYANNKLAITALEQLPPATGMEIAGEEIHQTDTGLMPASELATVQHLAATARRNGAGNVFLSLSNISPYIANRIARALATSGITLQDISTPQTPSHRAAGNLADLWTATTPRATNSVIETASTPAEKMALKKFLEGPPVSLLTGHEFENLSTKDLIQAVTDFYAKKHAGIVQNPVLGDVVLNRKGVKDSIGHGIGPAKRAAFASVPQIIAQGRIIQQQANFKGRRYDTATVAAPITIGNERRIAVAVLIRAQGSNRFYLHEAYTNERIQGAFNLGGKPIAGNNRLPGATSDSFESILAKALDVKPADGIVAESSAPYNPAPFQNQPLAARLPDGTTAPIELGALDSIKPVQMPEMVRFARDLMGKYPEIRRMAATRLGSFRAKKGQIETARIALNPAIFKDPMLAGKIFGHEIGHLVDFLPEGITDRGNILGRVASLKNYLKTTLPISPTGSALTPAMRATIRKSAENQTGPKPNAADANQQFAPGFEAVKSQFPTIDAWRKAASAKYAELLNAHMARENIATAKIMREELFNLSSHWRPIPENASPSYLDYRHSSSELYADAISALLNDPPLLQSSAPTFWKTFFARLDAKPEVKKTLFALQEFLNKPDLQIQSSRAADVLAMFAKGDEIYLRKAEERRLRHASFHGWMDRFRQELFDTFDPLVRRAAKLERKGITIPADFNPRLIFDEHPLADNDNYLMSQRIYAEVVKPVETANFTMHELGAYLFHTRILDATTDLPEDWRDQTAPPQGNAGVPPADESRPDSRHAATHPTRADVANPLGHNPQTSRAALIYLKQTSGPERFAQLTQAAQRFREIIFEQVTRATDTGLYSRKLYDDVLSKNKDTYATFATLEHLQDYVPSGIKMSTGTLKEIANPFTTTVLKMISLNRAIQFQVSKLAAVKFLQQYFPAEITDAPRTHDGTRWHVRPPETPDKALLEYRDDGKPAGAHVAPEVARMFDRITPATASAMTTLINAPFRKFFYKLIIQYNPGFHAVSIPFRNFRRGIVNMPGLEGFKQAPAFLRNYAELAHIVRPGEIGKTMRAHLSGKSTPLSREMVQARALGTPYTNFSRDLNLSQNEAMSKILGDMRLSPRAHEVPRNAALRAALAILHKIEFAGQTFELLPKIAAYKTLTQKLGYTPQEAAYYVRNYIAVPNITRKGRHTMIAEALAPFFKVFVNGTRSDLSLAFNPKTAGGWWLKYFATDGLWTVLQALAKLGILGVAIKKLYDGISDHKLTNYNVLPIGTEPGGAFGQSVRYLQIPRDETQRLISGLLYQTLLTAGNAVLPKDANGQSPAPGHEASNALAFGADFMPGLNTFASLASKWQQYAAGQNPRDDYRNIPVLTNDQWLAGGWPAFKGMMSYSITQSGVSNFYRYNPNANTTTDLVFSAIPGVNSIIGITDAGYREEQTAQQREGQVAAARLRLQLGDSTHYLLNEYARLTAIKVDLRTPVQQTRLDALRDWRSEYDEMMDKWLERPEKPIPANEAARLERLSQSLQRYLK